MKPKIFIGSSVEGLNISYAIQENLIYDAECTVWSQGIFELSSTTIETLEKTLSLVDFAVFVFSGDDKTIIRGNENNTVRDNVLFELGLFIGKLGRDRVFFIMPDNDDIYIPTDLLGITPGKFESNRDDDNYQAATGSVCNKIRNKIKSLGILNSRKNGEDSGSNASSAEQGDHEWIIDLIDRKIEPARKKLLEKMKSQTDEDRPINEAWLNYIGLCSGEIDAHTKLLELAEKYEDNKNIKQLIPQMLSWEGHHKKAIEFAKKEYDANKNTDTAITLAQCYIDNDDENLAKDILNENDPANNVKIAILLSEKCGQSPVEKLKTLAKCYDNNQNIEDIIFELAQELYNQNRNKEAVYLYDKLINNYPNSAHYWAHHSNTCLNLDLYDKAMTSIKKANLLAEEKESWLLQNIGNLLNNKGFYSEAIDWLNKGLTLDPESEYAHERLAKSINNKSGEHKKYNEILNEGRRLIKESPDIQT